ncbi:MAG: VWA domain-containing protein [Candidatus Thorarchaeota archaeon]|nr:VWA domain-containing protein [Candidatus Thorarchaeota archaeon]
MPLLRTSSKTFPASKGVMSDIPYVLRIEFGELARETTKIVGKPIACHKCNGFLISTDQIRDDPKVGRHFLCPFCGTLNVIEGEVVAAGDETDFVIELPPEATKTAIGEVSAGGRSFLALIDVSGSMAGENLSAVKRSLTTSIDSLAVNAPDTMFGLIEFESTVVARDLETGHPVELPTSSFMSLKDIDEATKNLLDKIRLVHVGKNADKLKNHVRALRDQGGTALGPAVAMASTISKHRNVGRVVLLTDGLANEGIGALEGYQVTPGSKFYENIGRRFLDLGTAVDVVGIASGGGMELKTLGLMPEITGGTMYYVTPNELDRSLSELAGSAMLGRDVEVKLVTPAGVKVKDASGASRVVLDELKKKSGGKIGVVGEDHELYFEVEPSAKINDQEIPIQVQVAYTDNDGARRVRAVTTRLRVSDKEEEIMKSLDPTVGATFVTQKAGEDAVRGDREKGKKRLSAFRSAMKARARAAPAPVQQMLEKADNVLAAEEEELVRQEERMREAPAGGAAPSAAADMSAVENLAQMKRSSKKIFEDEDKA